MTELAEKARAAVGEGVRAEVSGGDLVFVVAPELLVPLARFLKEEEGFHMLTDIGGVDYLRIPRSEPRFEVVYVLTDVRDLARPRRVRIRVQVPEDDPRVPSLVPLWSGANWPEREIYDLFGIVFEGHPDLRRILMPEDWKGHPLRKDYPLYGLEPDPPLARE